MSSSAYIRSPRSGRLCRVAMLALVVFALTQAFTTDGTASAQAEGTDFSAIDAYVQKEVRETRLPGASLGIVKGDEIVHVQGFGEADDSGRAVTPQTPFLIGSNGKSFTALAIMQLVEDGKVELDAPVQRYIPWFRVADPDASKRITVRHLLTSALLPRAAARATRLSSYVVCSARQHSARKEPGHRGRARPTPEKPRGSPPRASRTPTAARYSSRSFREWNGPKVAVDSPGGDLLPVAFLEGLVDAYDQRISLGHEHLHQQPWLERRPLDASELRALPLFASLTDAELSLIRHSAHEEQAVAGEEIVRQWSRTREFYVLLEGTAEVRTVERRLADLGPGDFLGEPAALGWGGVFGYPRLASVVATSPARLFVLPGTRFNALEQSVPAFCDQIRRVVRERLLDL
jgi:hypothetical protein